MTIYVGLKCIYGFPVTFNDQKTDSIFETIYTYSFNLLLIFEFGTPLFKGNSTKNIILFI